MIDIGMFLYNNFSAILLIYMIVKNTLTTNLLYLILKHQHCTCIEIKNRIPTCTQHLILAFKSKKCRKYAFYAGRESIISILKIPNPYNTAQKSH